MTKLIEMLDREAEEPPKKPFFVSREINLGHIVVTVSLIATAFLCYLSFHDGNIDNQNRVRQLEMTSERSEKTLNQLANNQIQTEKAVTQLTWIVTQLQKEKTQ
jgi:hypothetical protein